MKKKFLFVLVALVVSCASAPLIPPRPEILPVFVPSQAPASAWWNDAVFYEIYVRAFQDSDGDGIGDLKGLISRLDYLNDGDPKTSNDLGVTGLWLMPIFESGSVHGYDTIDYMRVEKDYGTIDDLKTLVAEAHKRGIRIILDLVLNHSSNKNAWFQAAVSADPGEYVDYYLIADKPTFAGSWRSLTDGRKYYGFFDTSMPDLNYKSPAVSARMLEVTRYWLQDVGLDGYRLDAIKYLIEENGQIENTPATHDWLKLFHKTYKDARPEAFTVGEVWDSLETVATYTGDQLDHGFHFDLSNKLLESVATGQKGPLLGIMEETLMRLPVGAYSTFLRNHDQTRVMNELKGDEKKARTAAALLLTLPGTPFLYYGEEIGQFGAKPDPYIRRPMQWDAALAAFGFTSGKPFGRDAANQGGLDRSVAGQSSDAKSLWSAYRDLIRLRSASSWLRTGGWLSVETMNPSLISYLRWDDRGAALVLANLGEKPVSSYGLTLWSGPLAKDRKARAVFGNELPAAPDLAVSPEGGFIGWKPYGSLQPGQVVVLELDPVTP